MNNGYFIVTSGEDGTSIDGPFTKEQLLKRITPDPKEEGGTYYGRSLKFLDTVPSSDKGHWDEFDMDDDERPILIIRGDIIVPKPVKVATSYDL